MRCFECRYLDRSKVLACYPPKYYCTYDNTTHFADDECKYEHYPIVQCKDCEHSDFKCPYPYCNLLDMNITGDGFCKWAKMKGGE